MWVNKGLFRPEATGNFLLYFLQEKGTLSQLPYTLLPGGQREVSAPGSDLQGNSGNSPKGKIPLKHC